MSSTIAASMATSGMLAAVTAAKLETDTPCAALRASRSAKDSVDELRAFLPDPQLRRRLGESELQLLTLVAQPPFGLRQPTIGAGSERSIPALPASRNWSRQLPTVAEDTPWRRAASASDNSPFNTANTTYRALGVGLTAIPCCRWQLAVAFPYRRPASISRSGWPRATQRRQEQAAVAAISQRHGTSGGGHE
jgi:hypothetical protein